MASGRSGVLASAGSWMRQLLTTVVRRQSKVTSSVLSTCRHQSTNVDEDDQVVVVDSKRLDATSRTQLGDHIDRQVRSSGEHLSHPIAMLMSYCPVALKSLVGRIHGAIVAATVGAIVAATIACSVYTRRQLASLGRHAQLTRCFSTVAELLVLLAAL